MITLHETDFENKGGLDRKFPDTIFIGPLLHNRAKGRDEFYLNLIIYESLCLVLWKLVGWEVMKSFDTMSCTHIRWAKLITDYWQRFDGSTINKDDVYES